MIAASLISIGDSSADSKSNLRASANFLEKVAKRLVSAQRPGKWRRATSAIGFDMNLIPEVLREWFALDHGGWSSAPYGAARFIQASRAVTPTRSCPLQDVLARDAETLRSRASVVSIKNVGLSQHAVDPNRLFPNLDPDVGIIPCLSGLLTNLTS